MSTKQKPKPEDSLSALGQRAERLLKSQLDDMDRDLKIVETKETKRQYSLLDRLKVIDRIAKFEAIRAKMNDEEGAFFNSPRGAGNGDE